MRTPHADDVWKGGYSRFDNFQPAEHRRGENIHSGVMLEKKLGDIATAHVGCAAQRRFEIAVPPIPRSVDQSRLGGEHLFNDRQIDVPGDDETFYLRRLELRTTLGKIWQLARTWTDRCRGGRRRSLRQELRTRQKARDGRDAAGHEEFFAGQGLIHKRERSGGFRASNDNVVKRGRGVRERTELRSRRLLTGSRLAPGA